MSATLIQLLRLAFSSPDQVPSLIVRTSLVRKDEGAYTSLTSFIVKCFKLNQNVSYCLFDNSFRVSVLAGSFKL